MFVVFGWERSAILLFGCLISNALFIQPWTCVKRLGLTRRKWCLWCSEAVQNASGPLLVEIDRPFCCSLGIELMSTAATTHRHGAPSVISISNIVPASIADRFRRSSYLCTFFYSKIPALTSVHLFSVYCTKTVFSLLFLTFLMSSTVILHFA